MLPRDGIDGNWPPRTATGRIRSAGWSSGEAAGRLRIAEQVGRGLVQLAGFLEEELVDVFAVRGGIGVLAGVQGDLRGDYFGEQDEAVVVDPGVGVFLPGKAARRFSSVKNKLPLPSRGGVIRRSWSSTRRSTMLA